MNAFTNGPAHAEKTMEMLWARVRQRGDLPGFSKVVTAIIGAMRGDDDQEFNMTRTVLQDPALTQKVLRLANSAMYSVFGQDINTVSKAVIVLGTEAIGHLALGLKLIDGLSSASSDSAPARAEMEKAVLAGHIARQVASSANTCDAEEAVVCSMLHSLGRMMTTFYLPDQWQLVQSRCTECGIDEQQAAHDILGLGLDEIGRRAAQQWSLPTALINTLQDMPPKPVGEPIGHDDWLAAVSTLSSRCADALRSDSEAPAKVLSGLAHDYAEMLGLDVSRVMAAVDAAQRTAAEEKVVAAPVPQRGTSGKERKPAAGKPAAAILGRGVADIRGVLHSANAGQLMSMALETVYQGLGFNRTMAFLRHQEQHRYLATKCFGEDVQELLPRLVFNDAYQPDVFHAALANDKMILVENAQDPAFASKLPRWWKDTLPKVLSFMVLPLTVNRQAIGFIYGDWGMAKPAAKVGRTEIAGLDELRTLVAQAIEQRRQMEKSWGQRMV